MDRPERPHQLMTPAEVALVFRVGPQTVSRWESRGRLSAIRTLGGQRRYYRAEIEAIVGGTVVVPDPTPPAAA